jgi:hypothetical protein
MSVRACAMNSAFRRICLLQFQHNEAETGSGLLPRDPPRVVAVALPGSPSTAYSSDHKDVGDREEDNLPEGVAELVNTGGLGLAQPVTR